jgi:hypothetical protein
MKFLRGLLLGVLGFSITAQAQENFDCLSLDEIKTSLAEFQLAMAPVIQSVAVPVSFVFQDIDFPIGGYAEFTDPAKVAIHVVGHQCKDVLTRDAYKLLLCHELGHAAGGAPFMVFAGEPKPANSSAEGQADFFATSSCLPTLFANDDNTPFLKEEIHHPELASICTDPDDNKRGLCMRIVVASLRFTQFVHDPHDMSGSMPPRSPGPAPLLSAKSKDITSSTLTRLYPETQCRLDTMIAGAQCQALQTESSYTANPQSPVSCAKTAAEAPRPACWFKN